MNAYRLDPLTPEESENWDMLIARCRGREVFHSNAWLDYLAVSRGIEIRRWAIRDGQDIVGYFCGGLLRLGPFRILGSPLRSWSTNFMGPVASGNLDQTRLLAALDALAQQNGLAMIELEHLMLSGSALRAAGYEPIRNWTYLVPLFPADPGAMWRRLDSTCRNRIRKAEAARLSVEDTDDPAAVDEYYDYFREVMRGLGMRAPFPREMVHFLFAHLRRADRLFALRVRDAGGRVVAVGLFLHDAEKMYFWSSAGNKDDNHLCPNDLMHWTAMRMGAARGLTLYDISGHGRFKRKFGGELTELARWHKCYWRTARPGRLAYRLWFDARMRLNFAGVGLLVQRMTTRGSRPDTEVEVAP